MDEWMDGCPSSHPLVDVYLDVYSTVGYPGLLYIGTGLLDV